MMVMTAKLDMRKIIIGLVAIAGVVVALILLFGGNQEAAPTATGMASTNDQRVAFLKAFGWEVSNAPTESSQVRIPTETTQVFDRYNALQKSQGYDLLQYAGKTVMRYVYKVQNFPGATEPVYATLLVYKNCIIGGDITNTAAKGVIQGFQREDASEAPIEPAPQETETALLPSED